MVARSGQLFRKGLNHPLPSFLCHCGDHAFATPSKPGVVMVSVEDRPILDRVGWFIDAEGYVVSSEGSLARSVCDAPTCTIADHRNHDKQDNRRQNIRVANAHQSVFNKRKMQTRAQIASRFKGVNWQKGRWFARIRAYGRRENLGSFVCETAAALAYDRAARRLHGDFAKLNILGGVS